MIVITGMHRSGTSFTSKLLHGLDVNFGDHDTLAQADRWNPNGYFENIDLQILHDKIVIGGAFPSERFRVTSDRERGVWLKLVMSIGRIRYLFFSVNDVARRAALYQTEMRRMADHFAHVAVKDPRFSFTISEWSKVANIEKILYCYRHPYEVALSLKKRYRFPTAIGVALWAHHVEEFFKQASGLAIAIINYNNFFQPSTQLAEMQRLFRFIEQPYDEVRARELLDKTLDNTLRRNSAQTGHHLPPYADKLYTMLHGYHQLHNGPIVFKRSS